MGMHVILTDTKTKEEIGNKTCGDALNLNAPTLLKEKLGLALPHDKEVSDIVETMVIQTETQSIEVEGDGYVVDRHVYGQRLLAEAISAGVEIRQEMKAVRSLTEGD